MALVYMLAAKYGFCCANLGPADLLRKPRIHTQSSRIVQPNLGHPQQQTHDRSRKRSSSAIRRNEATSDRAQSSSPSAAKKPRTIAHAKQLAHPLALIGAVCAHTRTLYNYSYSVRMIDDGGIITCRAGVHVRLIKGSLPQMA